MRHFLNILLFLTASTLGLKADFYKKTKHNGKGLSIEILSSHYYVSPGDSVTIGFHIKHKEDKGKKYHTYWRNPGIVGVPTTLKWKLPEGIKAGPIQWPYPEKSLMALHPCYGYERDVTLLTEISIPKNFQGKSIPVNLNTNWMCCANSCHPGSANFVFRIPVSSKSKPSLTDRLLIEEALRQLPINDHNIKSSLSSKTDDKKIILELNLPKNITPIHLFSTDNQSSSNAEQQFTKNENGWMISLPRYEFSPKGKTNFPAVLQTNKGFFKISPTYPNSD